MKKKTSNDFIKVTSFTVANVRIVKTKAGKELIFFTLTINEITIYNCRVATTKDNKDFIALPQTQGKNNEYYNNVWFKLSDEDATNILAEVERQLNSEDELPFK